ncbi:hypothetical protein EC957_003082 [Mortierella hygrophila]|uniref:Glutathione S-transferase C-terminal domain-containing protein n=1 Tax=Mortierella hygrophila TaxID=979708 RepID=A0A9P6F497_9FUNG|nr:hypothetical protein EC957_003082 [Mortierella hygrophila]
MAHIDASHFSRDASVELSEALAKPASYRLLYFLVLSNGATGCGLLACGGVNWSHAVPADWKTKNKSPFQMVPLLYVTGENGKRRWSLNTTSPKSLVFWARTSTKKSIVKSLHSSSAAVQNAFVVTVTWNTPEGKAAHERHLIDNGNSSHYVGDKLSLADIRTANTIEYFAAQPESATLMAIVNKSAPLIKLRDTVAKHPKLVQWRSGVDYKGYFEGNRAFYANPTAFM